MNKQKKTTIYKIKLEAKKTARGISASLVAFLILLILSAVFLLYQLKEYHITRYMKKNQELRLKISALDESRHYYLSKINELKSYAEISKKVKKEGLKESLVKPGVLKIDGDKLAAYVKKDKKISK